MTKAQPETKKSFSKQSKDKIYQKALEHDFIYKHKYFSNLYWKLFKCISRDLIVSYGFLKV